MRVSIAHLDRLLAEPAEPRALVELYGLLTTASSYRRDESGYGLPKWAFVFVALLEWVGSTRSGVWQYYEGLDPAEGNAVRQALDALGESDLADIYGQGVDRWREEESTGRIDAWIDRHEDDLERWLHRLVRNHRDSLITLTR